ncbi:uncharacterized protein LOC124813801 [Hydra vulgaris]|uniref:uncharacterized protein LOC124813801 n=1 Tax=Hydra vulgaris TaxID=6087 RepID=UPI0032EA10F6
MQQEILHISQEQQNMFNAFQKMVAVKKRELPECIELPIKTLLELKSLEKNLDNKDLAQAVSNHLGMRGGKDVSDTTRRILEKVFSNDLAKKLNWAGRCNKTGVKDLKIVSCIKAAVQINKSFDANEVSIENVVKS